MTRKEAYEKYLNMSPTDYHGEFGANSREKMDMAMEVLAMVENIEQSNLPPPMIKGIVEDQGAIDVDMVADAIAG